MRRVDSIMFYLFWVIYFVTLVFSSEKVDRLFDEQTGDMLQTANAVLFGIYFLCRVAVRYKAEKKVAEDHVFLLIVAAFNIVVYNFL